VIKLEKKLSEMSYGEEGVVKGIEEHLKNKVAGMGIRAGKKLKMITKQPIKGPVVVLVDEARTSLGLGIASKIIIEVGK
jgi:ferrous iron transport protein A